jgi:hypothetical protein
MKGAECGGGTGSFGFFLMAKKSAKMSELVAGE